MRLQKYIIGADPELCAIILPFDQNGRFGQWQRFGGGIIYKADEVDAELAAKDAEIQLLRQENSKMHGLVDLLSRRKPNPDAARLDKLPQCFHMLRYRLPEPLVGRPDSRWWLTYAPNNVYNSVREAIDAHQEPKP